MSKKQLRYRVGIDVGLYSVGLSAIEIDDSDDNPLNAMPCKLLSIQSVIHDGGVDPTKQKSADSRKATSGFARRARTLIKRKRQRLDDLDSLLERNGFPVEKAKDYILAVKPSEQTYYPWLARARASENYIDDDNERYLIVAVALRHIARHRGWRNPYTGVDTLKALSEEESPYLRAYRESLVKIGAIDSSFADKRLTVAQLIEPLLNNQYALRKKKHSGGADIPITNAQIGKLHQSDSYYEVALLLKTQMIPDDLSDQLIRIVFKQINPRAQGASAGLVAKDDLQPDKKRASKASIAFQDYRIITTLANLRVREGNITRKLSDSEFDKLHSFLSSIDSSVADGLSWNDIAAEIGIDSSHLKGTGGQTDDGEPISAKHPPVLDTEIIIAKAINQSNGTMYEFESWWNCAGNLEKEFFIDSISNSGQCGTPVTTEENEARQSVDGLLASLDETVLSRIDEMHFPSGRASYSFDTLLRLNARMLEEKIGLHDALKKEFDVDDDWRPSPSPLGTPTGNPAVDRTIKIVSRWLKACEREWGRPETINIEHVREGFQTPKHNRLVQKGMNERFVKNDATRAEIVDAINEQPGEHAVGKSSISKADIRCWQAVQRQNGQCLYCGTKITMQTCQMDHIVPRKGAGSSSELSNLVAACENCNRSKNNILFSDWATPDVARETIERVKSWNRDSYFSNAKQFKNYQNEVIARLKQKEEDEPLDVRSIESVAWMARELKEQIEGYFGYDSPQGAVSSTEGLVMQRVYVFRGWITSEARKASGLENRLPWIGGAHFKTRLDRRHHAVDASVIALMRPGVAEVLIKRESLRREQFDCRQTKEQVKGNRCLWWKDYPDSNHAPWIYIHWRDEQMAYLAQLLSHAMDDGDGVVVTFPKRFSLSVGRAHDETIFPFIKMKVGDCLSSECIDKAETPALWTALTRCPDYNCVDGLPKNPNRILRVHDKRLNASDNIQFMASSKEELDKRKTAVYGPVRGGYAGIGTAIHHARFYRIPKMDDSGSIVGEEYAYMRVFQCDLIKSQNDDLYTVELPACSISVRASNENLKQAFRDGAAEYLGWAVLNDEISIPLSAKILNPAGNYSLNVFMRTFPERNSFRITGFPTNSKVSIAAMQMSPEGLPDFSDGTDANMIFGLCENAIGSKAEYDKVCKVIGKGSACSLEVDKLLSAHPRFIRRDALGRERRFSNNHMPVSWSVAPDMAHEDD